MRIKLLTLTTLAGLLTACGGGGGAVTSTPPAPGGGDVAGYIATTPPAPIAMSALNAPAQWPLSFKSVSIAQTALVSPAERAATTNSTKAIFIQVWYLNQAQQRQTLAMLSLDSLNQMGGTLSLTNVPSGVTVLKAEVYTANGANQLTLASKDIGL